MRSTYEKRNGHPRYRKSAHLRKKERQAEAALRQFVYDKLTAQQKIDLCLSRPGNCAKELKKLRGML